MIALATVGTSKICESFLAAVKLTNRFRLAACYSRTAETAKAFAEKHGFEKTFTSLEEMAEKGNIDGVYIATPNGCHEKQIELFLNRKIHVICEKPIVTSAQSYLRLKEIADRNRVILMEAIIPIFARDYRKVKAALGEIGNVAAARINFFQRSSRLDSFRKGEKVNIFDMSLKAGALMDIGVYCVYGAVDFFGVPQSVKADCNLLSNGADGAGNAILNYGDFSVHLSYAKTCNGIIGSEIIGEKGTLLIDRISQYAGVRLLQKDACRQIVEYPEKAELMSGEAERFADYIEKGSRYQDDYLAASKLCCNVHRVMDAIKQSAGLAYPD